jgi:uncharacterized delta-60 repeat protein
VLVAEPGGDVLALGGGTKAPEERAPVMVRYLPDGRLDRAFGRSGVARGYGFVGLPGWQAGRVLADGRILVAGRLDLGALESVVGIARFLPTGQLDLTFGKRGRLRQQFGGLGCPQTPVAMIGQGAKTVLLVDTCPPGAAGGAEVVRLLPNGHVDRTFGTGGRVFLVPLDNQSGNSTPWSLGRQSDGKILVGIAGDTRNAAIVRLSPDGKLDRTFNGRGTVILRHGFEDRIDPLSALFELSDRSLVAVACLNYDHPLLYRVAANGTPRGLVDFGSSVHGCFFGVAQTAPGAFVGASSDELVKFDAAGVIAWRAPLPNRVRGVLVQADGRIVTAAPARLGPGRFGFELRRFAG